MLTAPDITNTTRHQLTARPDSAPPLRTGHAPRLGRRPLTPSFRHCLRLATGAPLLALIAALTLHSAENKIQFSDKAPTTPGSPLKKPGTDAPFPLDDLQSKPGPGVDPLLTTPRIQPNAQRQRAIEAYLDKKQNWMFADPKEARGQTSVREAFGVNESTPNSLTEDKKAIEKYWERERGSDRSSNTNRTNAREDKDKDTHDPDTRDAVSQRPEDSMEAGTFSPTGNAAFLRGPTVGNPVFNQRFGLPQGFGEGLGAQLPSLGQPLQSEPARKSLDLGRPNPGLGGLDPLNLKPDFGTRDSSSPTTRSAPSAADPGARPTGGLDAPRGLPTALSGPSLSRPADLGGPRFGDPASALAPALSPQIPTLTVPARPPVLEFPKRTF